MTAVWPCAVKVLLDHGAQVNVTEKAHGQTAVMFAAALNRGEVVKILAAKGADLKVVTKVDDLTNRPKYDDDGNPIPLKAGANATAPRGTAVAMGGMTALLFAARDGQMEATRALVEAGADVNQISDAEKTSPLVMALTNARFDAGKYLLD